MVKNKIILTIALGIFLSSCSSGTSSKSYTDEAIGEASYDQAESYEAFGESSYAQTESYKNSTDPSNMELEESALNYTTKLYVREAKYDKVGTINNGSTDFDNDLDKTKKSVKDFNGYFQESSYKIEEFPMGTKVPANKEDDIRLYKKFTGTIKVSVDDYQELYNILKKCGINYFAESSIINESEGYYSLKSQLEVKKIYKDRLLKLIENTKESEEILNLYARYFELNKEIDNMESRLNRLENSTTYSTIFFTLTEGFSDNETELPIDDEKSLFTKISHAIGKSTSVTLNLIGEFLILFAYLTGPILIFVPIGFILFKYRKKLFNFSIVKDKTDYGEDEDKDKS